MSIWNALKLGSFISCPSHCIGNQSQFSCFRLLAQQSRPLNWWRGLSITYSRGRNHYTQKTDDWTKSHQTEAATLLSPQIGIPAPILTEVLKDRPYKVQQPLQPDAIAYQQQVADKFLKLGLLPKSISVKEVAQAPK